MQVKFYSNGGGFAVHGIKGLCKGKASAYFTKTGLLTDAEQILDNGKSRPVAKGKELWMNLQHEGQNAAVNARLAGNKAHLSREEAMIAELFISVLFRVVLKQEEYGTFAFIWMRNPHGSTHYLYPSPCELVNKKFVELLDAALAQRQGDSAKQTAEVIERIKSQFLSLF